MGGDHKGPKMTLKEERVIEARSGSNITQVTIETIIVALIVGHS